MEYVRGQLYDEAVFIEDPNTVIIHEIKSGYTNRCSIMDVFYRYISKLFGHRNHNRSWFFFLCLSTKDGGLFESMKISYAQLENVPTKVLYEANLKTMNPNSLLKKEVNPEMFDELLDSHGYDPSVSVAAFDEDTGECVGMVLNGIRKDRRNTAYDILTCTIPEYRRMGIAKTIFEKVIPLLKEKGFTTYTTETKRTNLIAQNMYRSIGFEITKEVVTTLKTQDGTREVEQYELVMKL